MRLEGLAGKLDVLEMVETVTIAILSISPLHNSLKTNWPNDMKKTLILFTVVTTKNINV